mmetsp:Transcript_31908/g.74654  ORF Transcript_31908/g.74654 Transcript_31908/m.74654 type:complete len:678 (-) Transcript_31908:64-2097(-)
MSSVVEDDDDDDEDDDKKEAAGSPVEVIIKAATGNDGQADRPSFSSFQEYIILVDPDGSLRDVKAALASELRRPELVSEANFVTVLPNGMTVPISDAQKLGTRRILLLEGSSLTPKEEARPPRTLEDFDEFDPGEEIQSPRSLQACALEGISAEDLIYCPEDAYSAAGDVSPRRAQLRHDFFEALRQDQLASARHVRELLIWAESNEFPMDALSLDRAVGVNIDSLGGLPQADYPEILRFFQGCWKASDESYHLGEKSHSSSLEPVRVWGSHWSPKAPAIPKQPLPIDKMGKVEFRYPERGRGIPKPSERFDRMADQNDELREKLRAVKVETADKLGELKSLPGSKRHAHSQLLMTESRALTQQFRDSQAFYQKHDERVRLVQLRNKATSVQLGFCDREIGYSEHLRGIVEKRALRSAAADNDKQRERYGEHMKRTFQLHQRRCNTHRDQLAWENYRKEELEISTKTSLERAAYKHEVKNLNTVRYARTWARRRIRLELGRWQVSQGWMKWKADVSEKLAKKDAYTRDQKYLQLKIHDYRLELKALRDAFRELAAEREKRRQEHRRALKSPRLAAQRAANRSSGGRVLRSTDSGSQEPWLPAGSLSRSRSTPFHSVSTSFGQRSTGMSSKEPRFDFGRAALGAMASVSTASTISRAPLATGAHKATTPLIRTSSVPA